MGTAVRVRRKRRRNRVSLQTCPPQLREGENTIITSSLTHHLPSPLVQSHHTLLLPPPNSSSSLLLLSTGVRRPLYA